MKSFWFLLAFWVIGIKVLAVMPSLTLLAVVLVSVLIWPAWWLLLALLRSFGLPAR